MRVVDEVRTCLASQRLVECDEIGDEWAVEVDIPVRPQDLPGAPSGLLNSSSSLSLSVSLVSLEMFASGPVLIETARSRSLSNLDVPEPGYGTLSFSGTVWQFFV